jgi:hypothetical protein
VSWSFTNSGLVVPRTIPIDLRNAQAAANAGNSFTQVAALTDWEFWHWEFLKDVVGSVFGVCRIPTNAFPSPSKTAKVVLTLAANATSGVTTMRVGSKSVADAASLNPAALVDETDADVTVPGTAYLRKDASFTLSNQVTAGDWLLVQVTHVGTATNDTLAVNTLLLGAVLELT